MKDRVKLQKQRVRLQHKLVTKNIILVNDNFAEILIPSIHGVKVAIIDSEDVCKIYNVNWFLTKRADSFYVIGYDLINKKMVHLHRLITNCPQTSEVDHINRNPLDNRKENLKICSHFENMQNRSTNVSGKVGVHYVKEKSKWRATIFHNHKNIHIGYYKDFSCAVKARINAEMQYKNFKNIA